MLTEIYIDALLVDEELADQVWEAWDTGEIGDVNAIVAWLAVVSVSVRTGPVTASTAIPRLMTRFSRKTP